MAKRKVANVKQNSSDSSSSSDSTDCSDTPIDECSQSTLKNDSSTVNKNSSRTLRGCSVHLLSLSETLIEQACSGDARRVHKLIAEMETDVFNGFERVFPCNRPSPKDTSVTSVNIESSESSKKTSSSSSDSESDDNSQTSKLRKRPQRKVKRESDDDSEDEILASRFKSKSAKNPPRNGTRMSRRRRKIVESDDDDSDKTDVSKDKSSSSEEDSSVETLKVKKRRKRVKFNDSSDESDASEVEKKPKKRGRKPKVPKEEKENSSPSKGQRKNIRKLMTEKDLKAETKRANDEEKARLERIADKQKLYNEIIKDEFAVKDAKLKRCILEINEESKEVIVEIDEKLCEYLKPHQFKGIKFMWNCLIESVEQLKSGPGSGCILAHSMGLGKTLQVISFVHTLLTNEHTADHIKTVAIVCPVNTVRNWTNEFNIWLADNNLLDFMLFEATDSKTVSDRVQMLRAWKRKGGVLIIGIPLFSALICGGRGKKPNKKAQTVFLEALSDPGPDVVICDEGHLMKNEKTQFNKAVSEVRTLRRAILTGTPLQNNLNEYQVMAQFVKPNLLGTKKEFTNRFVNPITNGQCADSTAEDVMLMKKRVHVLHKLLDGCVQRFDYGVLAPYLQPKCEYVIRVQLTETQIKLYQHYLDNFCTRTRFSLLADYNIFRLIWNHPFLLYRSHQLKQEREMMKDEDDDDGASLKDFINDDESDESTPESSDSRTDSSSDSDGYKKKKSKSKEANESLEVLKKWKTRSRGAGPSTDGQGTSKPVLIELDDEKSTVDNVTENTWFSPFVSADDFNNYHLSGKIILLFSILEECERIGDKVLIFSQSLPLLDLIEDCLAFKMREERCTPNNEKGATLNDDNEDITNSWVRGIDYFRIDGSVESTNRKKCIDKFNDPSNLRSRLFLLSTKAGSLGINLVGANRCIIFDASWNPTHDIQAIFRIYRFGQTKPVYVYRFLAQGTMEEKIYDRQVMKQSLSCRVIDEQQVERHFKASDIAELYAFNPDTNQERPTPMLPKDRLLADILLKHKELVVKFHEHDSLLESKPDEDLTEEERKAAWKEFEEEKDEELQQRKREEQRQEFLRQQQILLQQQRQNYIHQVMQQQVINASMYAQPGKTSVTIGSLGAMAGNMYPNSLLQTRLLSPEGLPPYDEVTVENIWMSIAPANRNDFRTAAPRIYQVINTGLTYLSTELQGLRAYEKARELNGDEVIRKAMAERGIRNLTNQLHRLRNMDASMSLNPQQPTTITYSRVNEAATRAPERITITAEDLD